MDTNHRIPDRAYPSILPPEGAETHTNGPNSPQDRQQTSPPTRSPTRVSFEGLPNGPNPGYLSRDLTPTWTSGTSSVPEEAWLRQCVLSFDGGGIRGYSSLIILRHIMDRVIEIEEGTDDPTDSDSDESRESRRVTTSFHPGDFVQSPGSTGEPGEDRRQRYLPCHYFDYIGGTSTGGLISIMLGRLRMNVEDCIAEYRKFGKEIFGHGRMFSMRSFPLFFPRPKYDGDRLQKIVETVAAHRLPPEQRLVGAGNFNSPRELCKTVVFAYDSKPINHEDEYRSAPNEGIRARNAGPYIFRSYDHWGSTPPQYFPRNPGTAHSIPIWQVARATTAAPTYFETIEIQNRRYGDGGFGTNNPTIELIWEVTTLHGKHDHAIKLMVSIGTGQRPDIHRFSPRGGIGELFNQIIALKNLASDGELTHQYSTQWPTDRMEKYSRLDVPLEPGRLGAIKLDEFKSRNRTLQKIEELTNQYCELEETQRDLQSIAETLVAHRRARCRSNRWEFVSTGAQWRCTITPCVKSQKLHTTRESLRKHFITKHRGQYDISKENEFLNNGRCQY